MLRCLAGAAAMVVGGSVVACGGDDEHAGSSGELSRDAMTGDASTAVDALPPEHPELCTGLVLAPRVVDEIAKSDDAPPAIGGPVLAGIYDLEELDAYRTFDAGPPGGEHPTEGLSGRSVSAVVVVTTNTLSFIEADGMDGGVGAAASRGYGYSAIGTNLVAAQVCPDPIASKNVPYSAVGDALSVFFDSTHRQVFRKRPTQ